MAEEKKAGSKTGTKAGQTAEKMKINDIFEKLDSLVKEMEDPGLSLEASFEKYTEGLKLLKTCNESIDKIEKEIEILEAQDD